MTELETLKVQAFDTLRNIEILQANLRAITQKIAEIEAHPKQETGDQK